MIRRQQQSCILEGAPCTSGPHPSFRESKNGKAVSKSFVGTPGSLSKTVSDAPLGTSSTEIEVRGSCKASEKCALFSFLSLRYSQPNLLPIPWRQTTRRFSENTVKGLRDDLDLQTQLGSFKCSSSIQIACHKFPESHPIGG